MTQKANHEASAKSFSAAPTIVLYGTDGRGKPKAARFKKDDTNLAAKAASQLNLRVLATDNPKVAEIAAKLPVGRIHGTGRTFVPFVRRDLYDKLLAVAPNGNGKDRPSSSTAASAVSSPAAVGTKPPAGAPSTPRSWRDIGLGDLVVAQESLEDGWYEAIVIDMDGDMLTLRWRHYPKERRITRHRYRVALVYPGQKPTEPGKTTPNLAGNQAALAQSLPKDWDEISPNHLVLAKDDGPWRSFWEAVPVEKAGDGFKLRWRDYASLPLVTRPRIELALLYPYAP